jgi:hypothetical protein
MNIDSGVNIVVRGQDPVNVKSSKTKTSNSQNNKKGIRLWDKSKKRPSTLTFILLIALTMVFFIGIYVDYIIDTHEIMIEIEYEGAYEAEIEIEGNYDYFEDHGDNEYTYRIQEGETIYVWIHRTSSFSEPLTVSIYDDGVRVAQRTSTEPWGTVNLMHVIGE